MGCQLQFEAREVVVVVVLLLLLSPASPDNNSPSASMPGCAAKSSASLDTSRAAACWLSGTERTHVRL